jgi:hypothetical protein
MVVTMHTEREVSEHNIIDNHNTVTTLNEDRVVLAIIDKKITEDGYLRNFLPAIRQSLARHDELRLAVYFRHHHGWEQEAAFKDMDSFSDYAHKIKKVALINANQKEMIRQEVRTAKHPNIETRLFTEEEYGQALVWIME